jgi:hypothetical protein
MLNHAIQRLMEPRFKALYRVWKEDGDIAFAACRSHVVDAAVTAGAGRVETLELGHRYGISPRWLLSHEAEQPAVFVAWQPSMSFHRGGSDPKK